MQEHTHSSPSPSAALALLAPLHTEGHKLEGLQVFAGLDDPVVQPREYYPEQIFKLVPHILALTYFCLWSREGWQDTGGSTATTGHWIICGCINNPWETTGA